MRCSCFSFLKRRLRSRPIEKEVYRKEVLLVGCFANFADFFAPLLSKALNRKGREEVRRVRKELPLVTSLPNPASILPHHGLSNFASPRLLKLRHVLHHTIHPIPS